MTKKKCSYRERCSEDKDTCFETTECGLKEGYMSEKEKKKYRKEHPGVINEIKSNSKYRAR